MGGEKGGGSTILFHWPVYVLHYYKAYVVVGTQAYSHGVVGR